MGEVTIEQKFRGTVALTVLHLRRLAKSNDLDKGFAMARDLRMIDDEQEQFMRECVKLGQLLDAGDAPSAAIDAARVRRLQACVLSINSADPA